MEESDFSENEEEGDEGQEEELDPDNPEHAFTIMERNFNKTITDIEQNPEAAQFADEYNKLFEAYYQAYIGQKECEEQIDHISDELQDKKDKLELALKLADDDKKTIDELNSQIQNAWKLTDAAHSREQLAQEIIDNLRRQVENLNAEIDFKNKMNQDADDLGELSKHKDGLERERDKLMNEVTQLNLKLTNALSYQEELERKTSEADLKINEIAGQLEDQHGEINRQKRAKEKLETEMTELRYKIEDRDVQIDELRKSAEGHLKQILRGEHELKEQKYVTDKISRELDVVTGKLTKLQDEHNAVLYDVDTTRKALETKKLDMKLVEDENQRIKNDFAKLQKTKDGLEKKILTLFQEKDEFVIDKNNLRQKIVTLEREIDDNKKYVEEDKRAMEVVNKEKDVLNKTIQRMQAIARDQLKLIQIQDQSKKKMEVELDSFFIESGKQKKQIHQLERERDRLAEEQLDLTKTIEDNIEDIREKKEHVFELKKNLVERDNKIRQQQNVYEAIRADRNYLQKSLQESTAEAGELKKKLKIVFHQTEQLKEDIAMKEKLIIRDENLMRKITKEKENLKIEVMTGLDQIRSLKQDVKELREEEKRLHKTILDYERTIRDQRKDIEALMNERDVLGSQLVRRNDEIALLNEKIKILQSTLARGETQYDQRIEDIKLLKIEVKRLRQEKLLMNKSMNNTADLRQEIFHLERDLTKSRLKCKALEQEVQNPLNVHRWRKLEGSDPEVLDLLQKVKLLQKRLLLQAGEAVERERRLREAERLYLNLRKVLSRQPTPAVQEELNRTQRALKLRGDKLKCIVSELNMSEMKSSEYKSDLQRLTDELNELKRKYLAERKANRTLRMAIESGREVSNVGLNRNSSSTGEVRYTGGGFRMSVSQISTK